MKALGVFTWIATSSLVTALIQAAALRHIWSWFVSAEYGTGPSLGAWFGIATILGLIIGMATSPPLDSKRDESWDDLIRQSVTNTLARWLGCGVALGMTWAIGSLLGWVR